MNLRRISMVLLPLMLLINSCDNETSAKIDSGSEAIDLVKMSEMLQDLNDQFAENYNTADSVAVAEHYTKDGTWGSVKGKDNLISAWGKSIRYTNEKGTPNVKFQISSVSRDGEFVVEIGRYEFSDLNNTVKSSGKYLIVRKQEDGKWKIYRDIGL